MTAKQLFEYSLIELNKINAPSLLLEDYNYFINKAVNQYINKVYNLYDINQQKSDDLRVLKSTAVLTPVPNTSYEGMSLLNKTYEGDLPDDYLHLLNCVVEYEVHQTFKCYNKGDKVHFGAKRLTADMFSQIINNYYMRPTYKNPYYYINNVTSDGSYPVTDTPVNINTSVNNKITNSTLTVATPTIATILTVTKDNIDLEFEYAASPTGGLQWTTAIQLHALLVKTSINATISEAGVITIPFPYGQSISAIEATEGVTVVNTLEVDANSLTERVRGYRYGNRSKVRLELRYGKDDSLFELKKVYIDYLKSPQFIRLTQEQIDEVVDNSQILEFPDYVNQEVVNELIKLLMENASDPRLQTNIPINQSIANPAQEQQPNQRR